MDNLKILVVDDESRMRKLVKDFLVKNNYMVLEAADGEEAVNIFMSTKDIALIILDVMMPKLDGYGAAEEIRKVSDEPIIMLTAKSDERDELKGFELGVDEYITKPFSPKILVARVEAVLRRSNSQDAGEIISVDGIEMDLSAHQVKVDVRQWSSAIRNLNSLIISLSIRGLHYQEKKFLTMCGIMIILAMPELSIPMSRSLGVSLEKRANI